MTKESSAAPRMPDYGPHKQALFTLLARVATVGHIVKTTPYPYNGPEGEQVSLRCARCSWSCTWLLTGQGLAIDVPWCDPERKLPANIAPPSFGQSGRKPRRI